VPRPLIGDLARLGLATVAGIALVAAFASYRIWVVGQRDESGQQVDAVVVLGAAQYDGSPSPIFQARLDHAVSLVLNGVAPYLVVTGGRAPGDRLSEADVARQYALDHGVHEDRILAEGTGTDTLMSLRNVKELFDRRDFRRGLFVSDRSHMLRVLLMAEDLGMEAFGSPTRSSPVDRDPVATVDAVVHEIVGLAIYLVTAH
jgi:uncharacterized SAM-binding protein YcdF (DUF218 family)